MIEKKIVSRLHWLLALAYVGCSHVALPQSADKYDVMAYGAVVNDTVLSTEAIQSAIDGAYAAGGGMVYFPPGQYHAGTIVLKDNVTIFLEEGATLHASRDINDYRMPLENATRPVFLYANGAKNIALKGGGTIHGGAQRVYEDLRKTDAFIEDITENARQAGVEMKMYYVLKPDVALVIFTDCEGVTVSDITLEESSFWTLHILKSSQVRIERVKVFSSLEKGVNADGIDINSCNDVLISDCIVSTGDDAIALKSWFEVPCENIRVTGCVLTSSSTALKIGTESHGDFRNIRFDSCTVLNSNRGLSIVVRDGASVKDVTFSNINIQCSRRHFNWWGNGDPIWVYLTKKNEASEAGSIDGVLFEHIKAKARGTSKIESTAGMQIENIYMKDIQISMLEENYLDKRADHALYIEQVKHLTIEGFKVNWDDAHAESGWKSALVLSDVHGGQVGRFVGRQGRMDSDVPIIALNNSQDIVLRECNSEEGGSTLVSVKGVESRGIVLERCNSNGNAANLIDVDASVTQTQSILTE